MFKFDYFEVIFFVLDGLCVGVYPKSTTSLQELESSYESTLSTLYPQSSLVIIVILSHLFQSDYKLFNLFNRQTYQGVDRTHILYNYFFVPNSYGNDSFDDDGSKPGNFEHFGGDSGRKNAKIQNEKESVNQNDSEFIDNKRAISNFALLSGYANYNLKCGAFIAIESGLRASNSLSDRMKRYRDSMRDNLYKHLDSGISASMWAGKRPDVKIGTSLFRLSFITGSHLLVLNLDKRRNYVEKLSQYCLKLKNMNTRLPDFVTKFAEIQSINEPKLILPPLIYPRAYSSKTFKDVDIHPDMAIEKAAFSNQHNISIKSFYTFIEGVNEYAIQFVTSPYGYYQSKTIYVRDFMVLLLNAQYKVKTFIVSTGSPNQPNRRLQRGSLWFASRVTMSTKSSKITCASPQKVTEFEGGVAHLEMSHSVSVICLVIKVDVYQPDGFILYNIQLMP